MSRVRMYNKLDQIPQTENERRVRQMEEELFSFLELKYQSFDIYLNANQTIHAVYVYSKSENKSNKEFYIGHGFGGTSLMSFGIIQPLLAKGNVIFWQIRGMGFSKKLQSYQISDLEAIQQFFLTTVRVLLEHFKSKNSVFVCHSFSSYLLLRFIIKYPQFSKEHISRVVLMSTIGITIKEEDYKNKISNCSDLIHTIVNKFGWAFKLTYKSALRTICSCCKNSIIQGQLKEVQLPQRGKQLIKKMVQTLILLPDGSQPLFFQYFQPRVLPKIPLQPLIVVEPSVLIIMVYGGERDWVDKTGANKILARFPDKIWNFYLENCGHNIPFHTSQCIKLFNALFK